MSLSHGAKRRRLVLAVTPLLLGGCTMVGAGTRPGAKPVPVEPAPAVARPSPVAAPMVERPAEQPGDIVTEGVVHIALESIGTPYEWGGTDANGFDCSGLIQFAYGTFGIDLPRTSSEQIREGSAIDPRASSLRPGDVLGFSADRSGRTSHVGLYVGDDEFIHSSSTGVRVSNLRNPYWQARLVAARRIVE